MEKQLTVMQLNDLLKNIDKDFDLNVMIKNNLAGGWLTIQGQVSYISNNNNVIDLNIKNNNSEGIVFKLIGNKDKKFNVKVSKAKYKEIPKHGISLDMIKFSDKKSVITVDDNLIFNIECNIDELSKYL